jgi:hypothetical protein
VLLPSWPDFRDYILPYSLLFLLPNTLNILRSLPIDIRLSVSLACLRTTQLTLSRSAPASIRTTAASPCPLSKAKCNGVFPIISFSLKTLSSELTCTIRSIQSCLRTTLGWIQEDLEESVGSGSSCSMEGELGCSVFSVYLLSADVGVIWLTSAPFDIKSRPI